MRTAFALIFSLVPTLAWSYVPPAERIIQQWAATAKARPTLTGTAIRDARSVGFRTTIVGDTVTLLEAGKPTTDVAARLAFSLLVQPERAGALLRAAGIDLGKTGLVRNGDRIAWTIGASGEGATNPQIWIDRQWLAPVRLILRDATIEFTGYDNTTGRSWPKEITIVTAAGRRIYRIEAVH